MLHAAHFKYLIFGIITILLLSCENKNSQKICDTKIGKIVLHNYADTAVDILHITTSGDTISNWKINHKIYRCDYGDLTADGEVEIAIGVIKKTKYWKTEDKRLFIFKLYKGRLIKPLWLGSRLGCPIVDFRIERDSIPARIVSTEILNDTIFNAMYRIKGFGPKFEKYIK